MRKFYYFLWRRFISWPAVKLLWPRVTFGGNVTLIGLPLIQGDVTFGCSAVLVSLPLANPLGIYRRCIFEAIKFPNSNGIIRIGKNFSASGVCMVAQSSIIVGDNVTVGANATIIDNDFHAIDLKDRRANRPGIASPVVIESDVWIGAGALILKGVSVGRGSIVAAQAVVSKDVPRGSIVAGNPARIVKNIDVDE